MGTQYSDVYNSFLGKITDYNLPKFTDTEKEYILYGFLRSACVNFGHACKVNLYDRDDVLNQFNIEISEEIVDILSEVMITEWLKPKVLSTENLKNCLSTKDFSLFSPANLLKEMRSTLEYSRNHARGLINTYSFNHADFSELGGSTL